MLFSFLTYRMRWLNIPFLEIISYDFFDFIVHTTRYHRVIQPVITTHWLCMQKGPLYADSVLQQRLQGVPLINGISGCLLTLIMRDNNSKGPKRNEAIIMHRRETLAHLQAFRLFQFSNNRHLAPHLWPEKWQNHWWQNHSDAPRIQVISAEREAMLRALSLSNCISVGQGESHTLWLWSLKGTGEPLCCAGGGQAWF